MFKPTQEQEAILEAFTKTRMLKVNAFAGTGKSSSLQLLANANMAPSLYIAFNKAIADESTTKFPSHVTCKTTHSLAFAQFGKRIVHKLSRPKGGRYVNVAGTPSEIALYYKIKDITLKDATQNVPANVVASIVKDTVRRYEQSSDSSLTKQHISRYMVAECCENRPQLKMKALKDVVFKYATKLWEDRQDIHSPVLATHDTYLKLYQLSKPTLNFDIIYLDEAQDTGDTVLDIVLNQTHAKIVLVGDSFQSIYQFRGAVNAMEKVSCPTKYLTKSFRFGDAVAEVANLIIQATPPMIGFEQIQSRIGVLDYNKPHTRIYRTNSALLMDAINFYMDGKSVSCEIDVNDFRKFLESAVELKHGNLKRVKHDRVIPYTTWAEFKEGGEDAPEIKRVVRIVDAGQAQMFIDSLSDMKKKDGADVTFTTAHKSKGREWDQVFLADDFVCPDEQGKIADSERNLLYVAATRAVKVLFTNESIIKFREVFGDE